MGGEISPQKMAKDRRQDLPKPGDEFSLAGTAEAAEVSMGLQECLLDDIRGVYLRLQTMTDLDTGKKFKVVAIEFQ